MSMISAASLRRFSDLYVGRTWGGITTGVIMKHDDG